MSVQDQVEAFHRKFGHPVLKYPCLPDPDTLGFRLALIKEELGELVQAFSSNDVVEAADALADLIYVVYGTAAACGIPLDKVVDEVHSSNMSKTYAGHNVKPTKGEDYFPPEIGFALLAGGVE